MNVDEEDKPRAYTPEEVRELLLSHFRMMVGYWKRAKIDDELRAFLAKHGQDELDWRLEGLVHSILVTFDGGASGLPAFNIIPAPHPSDRAFHENEGENWYESVVINECQLHDAWHAEERSK